MQGENAGRCTVMPRMITFQCVRVWICTGPLWVYMYLGTQNPRAQNSLWRLILGNVQYCVSRVVCVCTYMQNCRREIRDVGNITLSMSSAPSELAKFVMILMRHNRVWKPQLWYILHQFLRKNYCPVSQTIAKRFIVTNADNCIWQHQESSDEIDYSD